MSRQYRCKITGDPDKFIASAQKLARENGVKVEGDGREGTVKVLGVAGGYRREGKEVVLTIHKKALFIPWGVLEKELAKFFGAPVVRD